MSRKWRQSPGASVALRRRVAEAIAKAGGDLDAFAFEHEDPEMWAANQEDRYYWVRLADAAIAAVSDDATSCGTCDRCPECVTCYCPTGDHDSPFCAACLNDGAADEWLGRQK